MTERFVLSTESKYILRNCHYYEDAFSCFLTYYSRKMKIKLFLIMTLVSKQLHFRNWIKISLYACRSSRKCTHLNGFSRHLIQNRKRNLYFAMSFSCPWILKLNHSSLLSCVEIILWKYWITPALFFGMNSFMKNCARMWHRFFELLWFDFEHSFWRNVLLVERNSWEF